MGRIVHVDTGYQSVSQTQDLLEVKAAATQAFIVHSLMIMQSSEEAATEAEELKVSVKRATGSYGAGTGGSTATATLQNPGDSAHGLTTINRNNTTQATVGTGTLSELPGGVFNVLAGEWEKTYTPELRPPFGPSQALILSLEENPADVITLRAVASIEIIIG